MISRKRHRWGTNEDNEQTLEVVVKRTRLAQPQTTRTVKDLFTHVLEDCMSWLSGAEICMNVKPVCKKWRKISHSNGAWAEVKRRCLALRQRGIPHPCDCLTLERLDECKEDEYAEALEYYKTRFGDSAGPATETFQSFLDNLPPAGVIHQQWWASPKPALRRARTMWQKLASTPCIRSVAIGSQHIEEHISYKNTFTDFEEQVGDLWLTDLYVAMGFIPPPHENMCGCDMHTLPIEKLVVAERRIHCPRKMRVHTQEHHPFCSGDYQLSARVNGYPSWVSSGEVTSWLYSSPKGVWTITNRDSDFENGAGHIAAGSPHNGWLPQANRDWLYGDGKAWYPDPAISIRGVPEPKLFFKDQSEVTPRMRASIIGWLSDIQSYQRMPLQMHTLFLAVKISDNFFACRNVAKSDMQLVACGATLLAASAENVLLTKAGEPGGSLLEWMYHLTEGYTKEQIASKHAEILQVLGTDITRSPTIYLFLERYLSMVRDSGYFDQSIQDAAEYISELGLLQYDLVARYRPSVIAAAALLVAIRTLPVPDIPCAHELRLLDIDVESCASELLKQLYSRPKPLPSYKKNLICKYSTSAHGKIALVYESLADIDPTC
eukprot:TRINITY_DN19067_c0_g1_i3.p1 TRINITY_DN19067_c0_g1~~TRINITY_DN19067_c0_g1_i3.p1  ORF type:complete len:605 (+),score=110.65 TRINITY_DN19067_c0_g1_i3:42-1856(+)